MNKGGLQNKAGEIIKELDELLNKVGPARKEQGGQKRLFEYQSMQIEDVQARVYNELTEDPDQVWENPNPILDTDGNPMPEFEAQFRAMAINARIQQDKRYVEAFAAREEAREDFYNAEVEVVTIMEKIGVLKAELAAITALLRLADDGS